MTITVPKDGFVDIEHFKIFLDISKVVYYSLEETDGCIKLMFYNKNGKVIKPYANTKEKASKNKSKKIKD